MADGNIRSWNPVIGIDSFEAAVDYYVDFLGFTLDWEWREAPGEPVIASISRDGFEIMLNEYPDALRGTWLTIAVADIESLAGEWNARRPDSVQVVNGAPYEFPCLYLRDPFGNKLDIQQPLSDEEEARRRARMPAMRDFITARLKSGRPIPTPEEITAAIGPSAGIAIEVLNEFREPK